MFKKSNYCVPPLCVSAPRPTKKGGMEALLVFIEERAGRPMKKWEADAIEILAKAANEDETVHGYSMPVSDLLTFVICVIVIRYTYQALDFDGAKDLELCEN